MHGVNHHSVTVNIGGRPLTIETGKLAKQAGGAVVVSQNDSSTLVTAVGGHKPTPFDFLPLTVGYQDRTGASGTIPGGFLKREGRPNERETLACRLIDRPIRPQFPKTFRCETQIITTALSFDPASDTDVLALIGASAACHISDLPLGRAIAGVRISLLDGEYLINPSIQQAHEAKLTLVVAGTSEAIAMVEGGANEASETEILDALDLAHVEIKKLVAAIDELREKCGVPKRAVPEAPSIDSRAVDAVAAAADALKAAMATDGKFARSTAIKVLRNDVIAGAVDGLDEDNTDAVTKDIKNLWHKSVGKEMRRQVIEEARRIDGRATDEVRDIWCEVGSATRAHGSAVFTRGETQVFATATLGVEMDSQRIDFAGRVDPFRRFMLQYNFPPFCTGEARRMTGPKRREVGHGALARRAVEPMLPAKADFPYVLRISADVLESNGSSSMASVCGATLSLMDAGVPLKKPVAGIAMGLIKEGDSFAVLSDILGDEDHLGDMDFKVTGTKDGITAFQMDTKLDAVPREVMAKALNQAREGRNLILEEMAKSIAAPREELSQYAPRITTIMIKTDKIRDIIGPGGKTIRGIQEQCGVKVTVDDTGRVDIAAADGEATEKAIAMVRELTQEAELGKLYLGVVKRTVDFGAFVEIFPGTEGLIHISHLAPERVKQTTDVVTEGDEVLVRVIDIDRSGKIRLSRKEALEATGAV